jgi:glycosyltransferase involved in cell wall biosynthesis
MTIRRSSARIAASMPLPLLESLPVRRIAYVCYWNAYRVDGVAKKISMQTGHWKRNGYDVEIFALTPASADASPAWGAAAYPFTNAASRLAAATRLLGGVRRFRPDVVYLRYDLLPPPLHLVPRHFRTVVEINSDHTVEYRRRRRAGLSELYGRWNWPVLLRRAAGVVSVTHELLALTEPYGLPSVVIGNGIDLDESAPVPAAADGRPTIAFAGTPGQAWHGVDKLVGLARARPDLDVVLVGPRVDDELPPNVQSHPYQSRDGYLPLLATADAALGSAAFHRNGMNEGSPLKVREYLACGLPVILPYRDTDLDAVDDWFVLRIPNEERNLVEHAEEIVRFVQSVRGRRVPRQAVERLIGAAAKEERRLSFFESLV